MFAVEIDLSTLAQAESGSVTGVIWLRAKNARAQEAAFPEQGWNDFAVVILGWWVEESAALVAGHKSTGQLGFMDGPYSVSVATTKESWQLEFVRRKRGSTVVEHTAKLTPLEVVSALIDGADVVLEQCDKNAWSSNDIDALRRGRAALAHSAGTSLKEFVDHRL